MDRLRALVIEDAADIRSLLRDVLAQGGFDVIGAASGQEGLDLAQRLKPDVITLDLTLPDIDGIEVCRRLRTVSDAYVIVLSARGEETDRLIGLEVGADDYMTKPFSPRELRARVGAMFRRPRTADRALDRPSEQPVAHDAHEVFKSGDLMIDRRSREVTLAGRPVPLTRIEFDLLVELISDPRRVFERQTLVRRVWQTDWLGDDHVIDVHVANLRQKLGDTAQDSQWVRTVRGVGYSFNGP